MGDWIRSRPVFNGSGGRVGRVVSQTPKSVLSLSNPAKLIAVDRRHVITTRRQPRDLVRQPVRAGRVDRLVQRLNGIFVAVLGTTRLIHGRIGQFGLAFEGVRFGAIQVAPPAQDPAQRAA